MSSTGLFVPLVRYQTCKHNILKTNDPFLMQVGTSDPRDDGMKQSTLRVTGSKVKITRGQIRLQKSVLVIYLKNWHYLACLVLCT